MLGLRQDALVGCVEFCDRRKTVFYVSMIILARNNKRHRYSKQSHYSYYNRFGHHTCISGLYLANRWAGHCDQESLSLLPLDTNDPYNVRTRLSDANTSMK